MILIAVNAGGTADIGQDFTIFGSGGWQPGKEFLPRIYTDKEMIN